MSDPFTTRRLSRGRTRPSPVFLAFVAVAVVGGILAWRDPSSDGGTNAARLADVGVFLLVIGGWVVTLSLHEFGHAYTAYRAGDRSVEAAGYLRLNPFKYAHPLLSIVLPLFFLVRGGLALPGGAVYLHPEQFRSRRMQSLCSLVGPLVNVVFAVLVLGAVQIWGDLATVKTPFGTVITGDHERFWAGLTFLGFLQVSAAVLNLLPIPGLDGYAALEPWLAPETRRSLAPVKPWGMLGLFAVLQFGPVNRVFFDVVDFFYGASGIPALVYQYGYAFFRFWNSF